VPTIYSSDSTKTLSEFIAEITDINSNIVIPDLQRPYIWNPDQVILLVDSIFKKWPFGSLLCWTVKISPPKRDYIPYRSFWQEIVRDVPSKRSKETSVDKSSKSFLMILDGQQRLQSLLLALGGDSWGFTLTDKDWKRHIEGKEANIDPTYWSTGCLCLNLETFLKEYNNCNKHVASIEVGKCISWVIIDEISGTSHQTNDHALPFFSKGKYVRFSKLWNAARPVGLITRDYEPIISQIDASFANSFAEYVGPLSEFMTIIADVKDSTTITRLIVKDFLSSGILDKRLYNNAIVNIFARLNTAGRALTPQEITLAWLKVGWREASWAGPDSANNECGEALTALLDELNDNIGSAGGLLMSMDNLVDILSMFWCILTKDTAKPEDTLLSDKDLVNGDIMQCIGKTTYENWDSIKQTLRECKDSFEHRKLNECFSRSFYAFNIICGWRFIASLSRVQIQGRVRERECRFETQVNEAFDVFIDRWFFCSQLSDTWSKSNNYPLFIVNLCSLYGSLKICTDPIEAERLLKNTLQTWIATLEQSSVNRINELRAYNRSEVSRYRNVLWLWNRLDFKRWSEAQKPMKRMRATPKLEVDHAVPVAVWEAIVEANHPFEESKSVVTGVEQVYRIANVDFTRQQLVFWINSIGNCSLLLRSHNRSKGDEQFGAFLGDIYSSEQSAVFRDALNLTDAMLFPATDNLGSIVHDVNVRTDVIKRELQEFIVGKRDRIDVVV
jgi:hypothetical protein